MIFELLVVIAARPNFVKVAPVLAELERDSEVRARVLHTGQHYDHGLSGAFLDQLGVAEPEFHLGVGSGSHAEQTAAVMTGVERVLLDHRFDGVLVAGDVNSTLAAALAAAKLLVPVIHLESGLRSGDWTMPEEINRVLTDRLSELLLCPGQDAAANLAAEGISAERVAVVGNTMIDSLFALEPHAAERDAPARLGLEPGRFALVTLHRPALVDHPDRLAATLAALDELAAEVPVVFPLHPRTRRRLTETGVHSGAVRLLDPLEYLDFVGLMRAARVVITDSGGIQEETSALGVPCVTYRTTTERPITLQLGTNRLIGMEPAALALACADVLAARPPAERPQIPLWDGAAGTRAATAIATFLHRRSSPVEAPTSASG